MSQNRRILGVFGANNPPKTTLAVTASNFLIGGIMAKFERQYDKAFKVNNVREAQDIFGQNIDSGAYGWDAVNGFFSNLAGVTASLWIKAHVGYTGSAIDAVQGFQMAVDGGAANTLRIGAGNQTVVEYGANTNRTGYTITNGFRFGTTFAATALAAATSAVLDSVAGIKVGDIIRFDITGGGSATVYKKITAVSESTKTVSWSGALHGSFTAAIGDAARIIGFQVKTYRKSTTGIVTEVNTELGKVWCTMEPEVTDFYVNNVFKSSTWLIIEDQASVSSLEQSFPVDVSTVTYLTSGADGTSPSTAAHWSRDLTAFDNIPVRFLANPETVNVSIQQAIETYSQNRFDNPIVIYNLQSDRTKAQLITIGQGYQRSDAVLATNAGNWYQVTDPFSSSAIAPPRNIPNVGHVMGAWIRTIGLLGVHYIPAIAEIPIFGILGIVGDQFLSDQDRTDLSVAGINVTQFREGFGFQIRNFFTFSTNNAYQFANGLLMRNYIKVSAVDSLQGSENKPNTFDRILADKMAIVQFGHQLWRAGSTGNVPEGETFGQTFDSKTGQPTVFEDHFEVQADPVNNPQTAINAGERNLDVWFSYPSPAGSIRIGVGILLKN